jgi:hypothetical protein
MPVALEVTARIDKWDRSKLKSFCTAKETISKSRGSPQNGRKSLPVTPWIKD